MGFYSPNFPPALHGKHVEIVSVQSKLTTITDAALANAMTVIDARIISTLLSCTDGNELSAMELVISTALVTAVTNQTSYSVVCKMGKEETFQLIKRPEIN